MMMNTKVVGEGLKKRKPTPRLFSFFAFVFNYMLKIKKHILIVI